MDKKKLAIIGGIAAVVIIGAVIAVVVANSGKSDDKGGDKGGTSQQTDKDGDKKDGDDKKSKTITADDLKTVDEIINYGDYEAQETLSKAIQNGEKDGKVVKIEGTVSHLALVCLRILAKEGRMATLTSVQPLRLKMVQMRIIQKMAIM